MLHTSNQIIKHKVSLFNLAEELQNVSKACKLMGVSRDTFYRYQGLASSGNNQSRRIPNLKNRVNEQTEQAVVDYAISYTRRAAGYLCFNNDVKGRLVY